MRTTIDIRRARLVIGLFAVLMLIATPARADLRWETELTYTAEVAEGNLSVESRIELTNLTPDERRGSQIITYYYDSVAIYVPDTVEGFRASSEGEELDHTLEDPGDDDVEGLLVAEIELGRRLQYGESMSMLIDYDVPADPPRSDTVFRINPAYFSFAVIGWGDPGLVTVHVVTPTVFEMDVFGGDWTADRTEGDDFIITFGDIDDPEEFLVIVTGRYDDALRSRTVDLEGFDIVVQSWPDDEVWADEVTRAVRRGLPELQRLIGLEWDTGGTLVITESHEVTLAGYGGWYLEGEEVIHIGEFVDSQLVLHELSHVWFNSGLFVERWVLEGLAEEFSTRAADDAGLALASELRLTEPPETSSGFGPLNDWLTPEEVMETLEGEELQAYEDYGYQASFWVIQEIVGEIGVYRMRSVLEAAAANQIAYRGEGDPETVPSRDDWRRFLDLAQEVGGSMKAEALFTRFVTDQDLSARARARAEYRDLERAADGWSMPYYVRETMSEWEFDEAVSRMEAARRVLATRLEIEESLTTLGITGLESLEDAYESSRSDMTAAEHLADDHLDAARNVVAALEAHSTERTFLMGLGLLGEDVDAEYQEAFDALVAEDFGAAARESEEMVSLISEAEGRGTQRLGVAGGAGLLLAMFGGLAGRRRHQAPQFSEDHGD